MYHERGDLDKLWKQGCCKEIEKLYRNLHVSYEYDLGHIRQNLDETKRINAKLNSELLNYMDQEKKDKGFKETNDWLKQRNEELK